MTKPASEHTSNLNVAGDLMQKLHKFLEIALISLTLAACIILYTVGLDQADLGYERRWTYPLFLRSSGFLSQIRITISF